MVIISAFFLKKLGEKHEKLKSGYRTSFIIIKMYSILCNSLI